ncbi:hypothetical protein B2J88_49880 [Rhodococcus sp. SRB_17]|nr:hypothetical protein [Rhodococcus sp. SRB_17]
MRLVRDDIAARVTGRHSRSGGMRSIATTGVGGIELNVYGDEDFDPVSSAHGRTPGTLFSASSAA